MKRGLLLLSYLCMSLIVFGKQVNLEQSLTVAKEIAGSHSGSLRSSNTDIRLVNTTYQKTELRSSSTVLYYVYNIGETGFVIVSGDDVFYPVIGYSFNGKYEEDNLSPSFKSWMSLVEESISQAIQENRQPSEKTVKAWKAYFSGNFSGLRSAQAVDYLVKTQWNQGDPYNRLCPVIDGKLAWTGCVATAMAQIMKYHNYPASGWGDSNPYQTQTQGISIPSVNFSNTKYNWGAMTDTYSSFSSETAKNAVATLMYHCGTGSKMDYGLDGSAAYIYDAVFALVYHFGYDQSIKEIDKSSYSEKVWLNMLITEINAQRPVLYRGASENSSHAFICDGYDNEGLFHFNWGWGGSKDGYYSLEGIEFNKYQSMVTGIKPNTEGQNQKIEISESLNCSVNQINQGTAFYVSCMLYNPGPYYFVGELALVLTDMNDQIVEKLFNDYYRLANAESVRWTISPTISTNVPDGDYKIRIATKGYGDNSYILLKAYYGYEHNIHVGKAIPVTDVTLDTSSRILLSGQTFQLTATVNPSNATNKSVTWSSSNASVASVYSGWVTAKSIGTATITVTTVDGEKTATCAIEVNPLPVTYVTLNAFSETLTEDEVFQLVETVYPSGATNKSVTWSSSNTSIASVSNSGLVTAKSVGMAVITVTTVDGGKTATCDITVLAPKSNNADLSNISVSAGTISPAFDPNIPFYIVEVESGITDITISATAAHSAAIIWSGTGTYPLNIGDNWFSINVMAEDGTFKTYVITVTRKRGTAIDEIETSGTKIWANNGSLFIEAANPVQKVSIHDLTGRLLYQTASRQTSLRIALPAKQTFIVTVLSSDGNVVRKKVTN